MTTGQARQAAERYRWRGQTTFAGQLELLLFCHTIGGGGVCESRAMPCRNTLHVTTQMTELEKRRKRGTYTGLRELNKQMGGGDFIRKPSAFKERSKSIRSNTHEVKQKEHTETRAHRETNKRTHIHTLTRIKRKRHNLLFLQFLVTL